MEGLDGGGESLGAIRGWISPGQCPLHVHRGGRFSGGCPGDPEEVALVGELGLDGRLGISVPVRTRQQQFLLGPGGGHIGDSPFLRSVGGCHLILGSPEDASQSLRVHSGGDRIMRRGVEPPIPGNGLGFLVWIVVPAHRLRREVATVDGRHENHRPFETLRLVNGQEGHRVLIGEAGGVHFFGGFFQEGVQIVQEASDCRLTLEGRPVFCQLQEAVQVETARQACVL